MECAVDADRISLRVILNAVSSNSAVTAEVVVAKMKVRSLSTQHYVFYIVSTHEFFNIIELRFNSLHSSSISSFLLSPDNHKSQDHKFTDYKKQFFLYKDKLQIADKEIRKLKPDPSLHCAA